MILPEIQIMDQRVEQLIDDGLNDSAMRLVSDTVQDLVLNTFQLEKETTHLVHYTTVDALFSMLSCPTKANEEFGLATSGPSEELDKDNSSNFIRMYDTYNANDPSEGNFLLEAKPRRHPFPSRHPHLWDLLLDRSRLPAYVASFRGISSAEEVDDLVFWRTYGKDGRGCAIVFPVHFLTSNTPLLRVKYGIKEVRLTFNWLLTVFDALASASSLTKLKPPSPGIPRYIASSLSPLPYLHKADDYKFEQETRVVMPFVDLSSRSLFCERRENLKSGLTLRHFANHRDLHVLNVLRTDAVITLGPAVRDKSNLKFILKRRLEHVGLVGAKICESKISYRS